MRLKTNKGFSMLGRRAVLVIWALGVAGMLLAASSSLALAQGPGTEALMKRDSGPPVPGNLRVMGLSQFGGLKPSGLPWQLQTIFDQRARQQVMPDAPHRRAVEFGPFFHRDPTGLIGVRKLVEGESSSCPPFPISCIPFP
jgi:hypothetical protein